MQVEDWWKASKDNTLFRFLKSMLTSVVLVVPVEGLSRDVILKCKTRILKRASGAWLERFHTYFERFVDVSFALDAQLNVVECLGA